MSRFDTVVVVDWSGGNDTGAKPRKDAIWAGIVREGAEIDPVYLRNRKVAEDWLANLIETEQGRLLIGFDFPFGFPAGTAKRICGSHDPRRLWAWFAEHLDDTPQSNNRYALAARINAGFPGEGPFWFNGTKTPIDGLPHKKTDRSGAFDVPERRAVETRSPSTFACWQMGGAGAVGSQAFTGMALLSRLTARFPAAKVWPFDPGDGPLVFAEIYPSLLKDAVRQQMAEDEIKDRAQVRILARALARMNLAPAFAAGGGNPEEGWILGVGAENALQAAARPTIAPPRLKQDCFALPPGVDWVPVDEALFRLKTALSPVTATDTLPVADANSRILARAPVAQRPNPPHANAAVDGYGFAAATIGKPPHVLPLAKGRAAAGAPFHGTVPPGAALRILTGAPVSAGVDTLVLDEDTTTADGHVAFDGPVKPGANVRKAGEDFGTSDPLLPAGHRLRPQDFALLSAAGCAEIEVHRPLRVGILSTGDELIDPNTTAAAGQIFDANRPMLLSLTRGWAHEAVDLGIAADDAVDVTARLNDAAERCDVILTSGGASAGDEDHISRLLRDHGQVTAWRIALKPGRPLLLGFWKGTPVFGLPGNPVAAFVCSLIFVRPALSRLCGGAWTTPTGHLVPAAFRKSKKPGRREYLRARLTEGGEAEVFRSEGSGRISGLSWAMGLVEIEDGAREIEPGDPVRFLPFSGFGL
ncbi:MAG: gephyrin-like molybdotransferase Glp [Pseudomonadota bacterium]